jgi:hypothetical protein
MSSQRDETRRADYRGDEKRRFNYREERMQQRKFEAAAVGKKGDPKRGLQAT